MVASICLYRPSSLERSPPTIGAMLSAVNGLTGSTHAIHAARPRVVLVRSVLAIDAIGNAAQKYGKRLILTGSSSLKTLLAT